MKVPYNLVDGQAAEIEVNSAVAEQLAVFAHEDENEARKVRWRNEVSIEVMKEEMGWEPIDTTVDIEMDYIAKEEQAELEVRKKRLYEVLALLNEKQQTIVRLHYFEKKSFRQIAVIFNTDHKNIGDQLEVIYKKMKKVF